jgi:hypothetical protein
MMTFRPYKSHVQSARVLDDRRLGKQRVEAMQIMQAAFSWMTNEHGGKVGWSHHPVVMMWAGQENPYIDHACGKIHLRDLINYHYHMANQWQARGFAHNHQHRIIPYLLALRGSEELFADHPLPWDKEQETAHKRILLKKDPEWYGQYWRVRKRD